MSTMIDAPVRASFLAHRTAATGNVGDDFARALRAAMRAYVIGLGGTPMMYQVGDLSVEPLGRGQVRMDGGLDSCMVTALFPGVRVRAFTNSPGGWFAHTPTPGYRPQGTSVICGARDSRGAKAAPKPHPSVFPALL
ncbi:MAG TPA: hypothetical protein VFJ82_26625 [Longimicrobium sp.]|nr:hypothetical protein [Longimicrobium sp.]